MTMYLVDGGRLLHRAYDLDRDSERNYRLCLSLTVPPRYSNRSAIIEVDRLSFAPLVGAATPVHLARRPHLDAQDLGSATTGKPRLAATTRCLAAFGSKTVETDAR